MKRIFQEVVETIRATFAGYGRDNGSMLAAGLAYYTIFAIAPLLVIAVAVAGFFFGDAAVQGQIVTSIEGTVGEEAAVVIQNLVRNARESGAGTFATALSAILLLFGASGLFSQLQRALNAIWGIVPAPNAGVVHTLYQRLLAFGMVLIIGLFLLLSLAVTTVLASLEGWLAELLPQIAPLLPWLDLSVVLLLLTALFAVLFRVLPAANVAWRDVGVGALATAVLFTIGRYLISWYLTTTSASSAYGAAGSLVVILLFVYYSAQILLIGAEFTQVYAIRYGSRLRLNHFVQRREGVALSPPPAERTPELAAQTAVAPPAPMTPPPAAPGRAIPAAATGMLGLALGLLIAFLFSRREA